jgi:fatty-acid desaturase
MKLRESAQVVSFNWKNTLWIGGLHVLTLAMAVPFFTWQGVAAFFVFHYLACMVGITFCFHRMLTHRSFQVPRWLENVGALCGTLACQGGPISWVGGHRIHHMYSDRAEDPHNASRGFWYSHVGWIINRREDLDNYDEFVHYAPDLARRKWFVFLEKNMILVQNIFGWGMFFTVAFLARTEAGMNWHMGWSFVVYGVFMRLVAGYHVTWFVNSAAHKWGSNDNQMTDLSTNNWWVGLLAFGEGWHNNHHAQPRSARHGWTWKQIDQTWLFIKFLSGIGLLNNIQLPKIKESKFNPATTPAAPGVSMVVGREAVPLSQDS